MALSSLVLGHDVIAGTKPNSCAQQLRENRLDVIHDVASFAKRTGNDTGQKPLVISNRRNQESCQNQRQCWITAK